MIMSLYLEFMIFEAKNQKCPVYFLIMR